MPDASTIDPAVILERVEDFINESTPANGYERWSAAKEALQNALRTALADTRRVDFIEKCDGSITRRESMDENYGWDVEVADLNGGHTGNAQDLRGAIDAAMAGSMP